MDELCCDAHLWRHCVYCVLLQVCHYPIFQKTAKRTYSKQWQGGREYTSLFWAPTNCRRNTQPTTLKSDNNSMECEIPESHLLEYPVSPMTWVQGFNSDVNCLRKMLTAQGRRRGWRPPIQWIGRDERSWVQDWWGLFDCKLVLGAS